MKPSLPKAPACEVGRLARAFKQDTGTALASVEGASKVHETHGERDSQRLFKKFGITLPIPIRELRLEGTDSAGPVVLPYLKLSEYFSYLLRRCPEILLGGHARGVAAQDLCVRFWRDYKKFHPEHIVFAKYPEQEQWGRIVPVALHGDKGRGFSKQPLFCFSFESVFGLPHGIRSRSSRAGDKFFREHGGRLSWTCAQREREQLYPHVDFDAGPCPKRRRLEDPQADDLQHNGRGHVFLTRFLGTAIPAKMFKDNPQLVPAYLQELQQDMTQLWDVGVDCEGERFYAGLIGIKGDLEYHLEIGEFSRSYTNIGTINTGAFCPECWAGSAGVEAFDAADRPGWVATMDLAEPWQTTPPLSLIPYSQTRRVTCYRRDAFHILKYGFLKDLAAGVIIWLSALKHFDSEGDSRALDNRLARAFSYFKLWCLANKKTTTLRKFSKGTFHRTKASKFPFIGGKGADAIVVLEFLEWFLLLQIREEPPHLEVLHAMLETIQGALGFTGTYHSHPIFMPPGCAQYLLKTGTRLFRGYLFLARRCVVERRKLFTLRPKLHYFAHVLWDLRVQIERGDSSVFNYPAVFNNEANEDFIGRVSRISKRVSPKLVSRRTINRYLVATKLVLKRAGFR